MDQAHLDTLRKNYDELIAAKAQACLDFANIVTLVDMSSVARKEIMNAFAECMDAQALSIAAKIEMNKFEEYMNG